MHLDFNAFITACENNVQHLQSAKQFYASLNWLCCQQEREPTQVTPPLEAILSATQAIAEAILPATRAMLAPFSVKEYSERETIDLGGSMVKHTHFYYI